MNSDIRKHVKEIEDLEAKINDLSQGNVHLTEELERVRKEHQMESENQQNKIGLLQKENDDLLTEVKVCCSSVPKNVLR